VGRAVHGIIFSELKAFIDQLAGPAAWQVVCEQAGLAGRIYAPFGSFPDEEVVRLVESASRSLGREPQEMLRDFGTFIAPHLLQLYKHRIDPSWGPLELIEHTEPTIHEVLRSKDPHAKPPRLVAHRTAADTVVIHYDSHRRLCAIAKGIILGIGEAYGSRVLISETECMLAGARRCSIVVQRLER
jgi:hypothetical protein